MADILLSGLRVVQVGRGLAAAVCGRLFADMGAEVACIDPDVSSPLAQYLDHGKAVAIEGATTRAALSGARLSFCEGRPAELRRRRHDADALRLVNETAALIFIAPFGQTGPRADDAASDLTLFCSSGIARMLTGQVDDLSEPPMRPVGEQSAFIGGLAAACAGDARGAGGRLRRGGRCVHRRGFGDAGGWGTGACGCLRSGLFAAASGRR